MNSGLANITARRIWFVPGFVIWGLPVLSEVKFLVVEEIGSQRSIGYSALAMGDRSQQVAFGDLTDHRGNRLPAAVPSPRVIVRARGAEAAFITGQETDTHFTIARAPDAAEPVTADLLVIELGG